MNLMTTYRESVRPRLKEELGLVNIMQAPTITKVVLNMGVGEAVNDRKVLDNAVEDLTKIAGQKAVITKARKSVASFKVREGFPIGCKVTLRGKRMWDFIERLVHIAMPRIRDFRGLPVRAFDGRGNFNIGVHEQIIFPEIDYDQIDKLRGLDITFVSSSNQDQHTLALLQALGFPFRTQSG